MVAKFKKKGKQMEYKIVQKYRMLTFDGCHWWTVQSKNIIVNLMAMWKFLCLFCRKNRILLRKDKWVSVCVCNNVPSKGSSRYLYSVKGEGKCS